MNGGDDDFCDAEQEDVIPGDNDKQGPPQTPVPHPPINKDAPDNLTQIQADPNGDVTITPGAPKP